MSFADRWYATLSHCPQMRRHRPGPVRYNRSRVRTACGGWGGRRGGAARDTILDVMGESAIASPLVGYKLEPMRKRDFSPTFSAKQMAKDYDLLLAAGRNTNTPLPLAAFVRQIWSSMIASGYGEEDFLAYVKIMESLSGTPPEE